MKTNEYGKFGPRLIRQRHVVSKQFSLVQCRHRRTHHQNSYNSQSTLYEALLHKITILGLGHTIKKKQVDCDNHKMNCTAASRARLVIRSSSLITTSWTRNTVRAFHRGAKIPAITASEARRRPTNNTRCQNTASLPVKLPTTTRTIFIQTQSTPNQVSDSTDRVNY